MLTEQQKRVAQAIVNIFETGSAQGEYGQVTVLPGDSGHLTYGRSQTTLSSGNLFLLIRAYCEAQNARFATPLQAYLERLKNHDTSLDHDATLRQILHNAGDDPVMQAVQNQFFDRVYWQPGVTAAQAIGISTPLGTAVVYDSTVHGSWQRMRDRTVDRFGRPSAIGERAWVGHYVDVRRDWLATHANTLLRRTVYRMDAFGKLIAQGNWELTLPLTVRSIQLDEDVLSGPPPVRVSAQGEEERLLLLRTPFMHGEDVRAVQQALVQAGLLNSADGVFGPRTEEAVQRFQTQRGLRSDGIVGPATRAALGL
jgi:chitosanase